MDNSSHGFGGPGPGGGGGGGKNQNLPTPASTPTQGRKSGMRRKSNLFKKGASSEFDKSQNLKHHQNNGELGSGRAIPVKQGMLYKRSSKALNKEWKKKYVALLPNATLTYHPNLNDYMGDSHGKEIDLRRTTVKKPGRLYRPRSQAHNKNELTPFDNPSSNNQQQQIDPSSGSRQLGSTSSACEDTNAMLLASSGGGAIISNGGALNSGSSSQNIGAAAAGGGGGGKETPHERKKRHRRMKSAGKIDRDKDKDEDSDGYEFLIVSLDNKQWTFEATSSEERDEWISEIERQIHFSFQSSESSKSSSKQLSRLSDQATVQSLRTVPGNDKCADCSTPNPDWASLNLGAVICIECSGIHRQLGTHISRVRSLDLDEWPHELVAVMCQLGNSFINNVWEANLKGKTKPSPNTPWEEKRQWIRAKYEQRLYLKAPPYTSVPVGQQLIDSVHRDDLKTTVLLLAIATRDQVNAPFSQANKQTALHIAAARADVVLLQLLLWYNADVKTVDHDGHTALWHARRRTNNSSSSNSGGCGGAAAAADCVRILINNGCPDEQLPSPGAAAGTTGASSSSSTLSRRNKQDAAAAATSQIHHPEKINKLPASVI